MNFATDLKEHVECNLPRPDLAAAGHIPGQIWLRGGGTWPAVAGLGRVAKIQPFSFFVCRGRIWLLSARFNRDSLDQAFFRADLVGGRSGAACCDQIWLVATRSGRDKKKKLLLPPCSPSTLSSLPPVAWLQGNRSTGSRGSGVATLRFFF